MASDLLNMASDKDNHRQPRFYDFYRHLKNFKARPSIKKGRSMPRNALQL